MCDALFILFLSGVLITRSKNRRSNLCFVFAVSTLVEELFNLLYKRPSSCWRVVVALNVALAGSNQCTEFIAEVAVREASLLGLGLPNYRAGLMMEAACSA